jgi:hypothetical protein
MIVIRHGHLMCLNSLDFPSYPKSFPESDPPNSSFQAIPSTTSSHPPRRPQRRPHRSISKWPGALRLLPVHLGHIPQISHALTLPLARVLSMITGIPDIPMAKIMLWRRRKRTATMRMSLLFFPHPLQTSSSNSHRSSYLLKFIYHHHYLHPLKYPSPPLPLTLMLDILQTPPLDPQHNTFYPHHNPPLRLQQIRIPTTIPRTTISDYVE